MAQHTAREIMHALNKAEADAKAILAEEGMPDGWNGAWTRPESLSECVRLADGVLRKIVLARDARRRGDHDAARTHHVHADALLASVHKQRKNAEEAAKEAARRTGLQKSAEAKRKAARTHWSNKFYALAFSKIKAEGKKKKIGGVAIYKAAWILARDAGVDDHMLEELTPDRARGWIERNPS